MRSPFVKRKSRLSSIAAIKDDTFNSLLNRLYRSRSRASNFSASVLYFPVWSGYGSLSPTRYFSSWYARFRFRDGSLGSSGSGLCLGTSSSCTASCGDVLFSDLYLSKNDFRHLTSEITLSSMKRRSSSISSVVQFSARTEIPFIWIGGENSCSRRILHNTFDMIEVD